MYINSIKIKNYRNYENFYMQFKEGLNVIIGANNSGKTNLLHAINLLKDLNIEIHDFNKNNLLKKYMNEYKKEAPGIEIESNNQNGWIKRKGYASDEHILKHIINYMKEGKEFFNHKIREFIQIYLNR